MNEINFQFKSRSRAGRKVAAAVLLAFVVVVVFADLIAPYDPGAQSRAEPDAPATDVHFYDGDQFDLFTPYVYRLELVDALGRRYEENRTEKFAIGFFVAGEPYDLFGLILLRVRLFGVNSTDIAAPRINLLGTDSLGRDRFSRLLAATRFSLIVCPIGVILAWLIGTVVGVVSGYSSSRVDAVLMGAADTMLALPTLILILTVRAAFPLDLAPLRAALLLVVVFALTGWAEIARIGRGLVRSLREREFVLAARATGNTETRILFRHILPNALPTLLNQAAVMLPYFLLAEVALSFLGVGLQEPQASLGNMLAAASDINQLQKATFLLLTPGFVIFAFVAAVRSLGRQRRSLI